MSEHETMPEGGVCRHGEGSDPTIASERTRCEFRHPRGNHVTDVLYLVAGNLLTLTVIGAVVGLPLMRWALSRMQRRSHTGLNRVT